MPKISKDTAVRLLTILFTPISGGLVAWTAKKGVQLPNAAVVTLGVTTSLGVLTVGLHWLMRQPAIIKGEEDLERLAGKVHALLVANPPAAAALTQIEAKIDNQRTEIVNAVANAVGAPTSAKDVALELLQALSAHQPAAGPAAAAAAAPAVTGP